MNKKILLSGLLLSLSYIFTPNTTQALSVPVQTKTDFALPLLSQIVKDSGVEMKKFQQCMHEGTWYETISKSIEYADTANLSGTPETFVFAKNGIVYRVQGSNKAQLETLLEDLKAGKKPSTPEVILPENFPAPNSSNEPGWGEQTAPVQLVVYVDLLCPYCRQLDQVLIDLEEKYQGFIQIIYRDYPIVELHPQSYLLAHAAQCTFDQGKYWDFVDQIYRWTPKTSEFETQGITEPKNRWQYNVLHEQTLTIFDWFTGETTIVTEKLDSLFPELAEDGVVMELLAEPNYPDSAVKYAFFQAINLKYEAQPATNFYALNKKNRTIKRMNISKLLPANRGEIKVSTTETKLAWSPVGSGGSARELYVFDLLTDTRKLVKTLPVGQTFDKGDGTLLNFSSDFEWLDENTIGYKVYNQKNKVFIKDGIIKLK